MLVIGSLALFSFGVVGSYNDTDVICTKDEYLSLVQPNELVIKETDTKIVTNDGCMYHEYNIIPAELDPDNPYSILHEVCCSKVFRGVRFATPEACLAIKYCHRFKDSKHFDKTRNDIKKLEALGIKRQEHELFTLVEKLFLRKPVSLAVKADEFFRKEDKFYKYKHDDIHAAIVYPEEPAYKKILKGEVQCSKELFDSLNLDDKLACAIEETFVLLLERSVIPNSTTALTQTKLEKLFDLSLRKVCTRITSGYFREFCWDNQEIIKAVAYPKLMMYYSNWLQALNFNRVSLF